MCKCVLFKECMCVGGVFLYIRISIKHLWKYTAETGDSGFIWRRGPHGLEMRVVSMYYI